MANVEQAVHTIRHKIEVKGIGILVDCTNAYNTVSREAILTELKAHPELWPIYRLASWSLRHTKLSVMSDGRRVVDMQSESGVRQGSVLGPVLFALALQPLLRRINSTCAAEADAYLDDITISADSIFKARTAFELLEVELARIGLRVNRHKTIALGDTPEAVIPGISQARHLAKLLGAAAWIPGPREETIERISKFVDEQMGKHDKFFQAVDEVGLAWSTKMLLLRSCGVGRPTFLLRTHPQQCSTNAAAHFDQMMENSLKKIVGVDAQLDDIASLPCKMGGLGLRAVSNLTEIAYHSRKGGEQHMQTHNYELTKRTGVMADMTEPDRDILRSFSKVDTRNVRCSDDAFRLGCRERLFLPTAHRDSVCRCGASLTTAHVHTCKKLTEAKYSRHDRIKVLLDKYAKRQFATRLEPSRLLQSSRGRPDLTVLLPAGDIHIDVSVTYVGSAQRDALARREREKRTKYKELGESFYPFIIGHTGELSKSAVEVLSMIIPHKAVRDECRVEIVREIFEGNLRLHQAAVA